MKIFISYSRADAKETANVIHDYLTKYGPHEVFIDTSNIPYGGDWNEVIQKEISNCDIFVIIVTPSALYRSEVEKEVELAKNMKKKIIPCIAKDYVAEDEIKWGLNRYQGFFYDTDSRLAMDLHRMIKREGTTRTTSSEVKSEIERSDYTSILEEQDKDLQSIPKGKMGALGYGVPFTSSKTEDNGKNNTKFRNYENKTPVVTNEKTIPINDIQKDTKIQDDISLHSVQWYIDKAKDFESLGRYNEALEAYDKAIEKQPYNFQIRFNKFLFLNKNEKLNEALEAIKEAIMQEPKNTDGWYHKAYILEKLERYEEAIEALDVDLKLDSKDVKSWTSKAKILEKLKKFEESIQCYDKALNIEPKNTDIQSKKKLVLDQLNKKTNEEKNKSQSYNLSKQGDTFFEQKKYSEALKCYDMALKLYPNNKLESYNNSFSAPYNRFLLIYLINKEKEDNPSQELIAIDTDVLIGEGLFLSSQGYKEQEAIECFDKALVIDPNQADALYYKGYSLYKEKRYDEAIECLDKALVIEPTRISTLFFKATVFQEQTKYQEAIECFDKALEIDPNYGDAFHDKGVALLRQRKYQEAIECFDKALAIDPNQADGLANKSSALSSLGKHEEAIELLNKALEIDPNYKFAKKLKNSIVSNYFPQTLSKKRKFAKFLWDMIPSY